VAQVQDNGRANVLGVGLTPSKGLDKGVVVNIDDAVNAISTSVENFRPSIQGKTVQKTVTNSA
jgi:cell division ATPase FtsA